MATHDITLPGNQRPQWPDLCVCCGQAHPGNHAGIAVTGSRSTLGWATETALLATGTTVQGTNVRVKLEVPCCSRCSRPLERRHFWKTVALYASGLLGAAACIAVIMAANSHGLSSGTGTFLGVAALLAVLAIPVVYELKRPPPFTITPMENRITYEFVTASCAEAFARANEDPGS